MLSVLGIAALAVAVPAHATVYTVNFTGTVFDSTTSSFLDFTIAGQSVAPGYQSFASIIPAQTDGDLYRATVSGLGRLTQQQHLLSQSVVSD